jgi:hypothetical protein
MRARAMLGVLSAGVRNSFERVRGRSISVQSEVAERDDADQPFVSIEHRQAMHLNVAHIARDLFDGLIFEAVLHLARHHITYR